MPWFRWLVVGLSSWRPGFGPRSVSPYKICGGRSRTMTGFSPGTSGFACQYHATNAAHSSSSTCCSCQKDQWVNFTFMLPCIVTDFSLNNQPDALIIQLYSVIKIYMFRVSYLSIIRSFLLYIRHWQVSCRFLMTASKQSLGWKAVPS